MEPNEWASSIRCCVKLEVVLCKIGGGAVVAPCCLVFFVAGGELSSCLSDIRFVAVRAS